MSKKMFKRSLALGALMAFVITGQAWAAGGPKPGTASYILGGGSDAITGSNIVYNSDYNEPFGIAVQTWENGAIDSFTVGNDVTQTIEVYGGTRADKMGSAVFVNDYGCLGINDVCFNATQSIGFYAIDEEGAALQVQGQGNNNTNVSIVAPNIALENTSGTAIVVTGGGRVDIGSDVEGTIIIKGVENSITARGESVININDSGKHTVKIDGDINFHKFYNTPLTDAINGADADVNLNLTTVESYFTGNIIVTNNQEAVVDENKENKDNVSGMKLALSNGASWNTKTGESFVNTLAMDGGILNVADGSTVTVGTDVESNETKNLGWTGNGTVVLEKVNESGNAVPQVTLNKKQAGSEVTVATAIDGIDSMTDDEIVEALSTMQGAVVEKVEGDDNTGSTTQEAANFFANSGKSALYEDVKLAAEDVNKDNASELLQKTIDSTNIDISDLAAIGLMSWRAEMNDMNKRMGELRNANGEHGVWVRMVRGEDEYNNVKSQYNQYQLGYDEKLSVDKRWTVGMALSYTDAENSFAKGNGESTNKALSVYGSKLNDDGTFVDLIAKYARLENDFKAYDGIEDADYSTNGYSVSAEFGKRIQQGKGLWIEPQVELTYGKVSAVDYLSKAGVKVAQDGMESIVGRVGFAMGKDISRGNVYARASYLYDFDGETAVTLNGKETLEQDLGGGWWEVGVGANINLSKATYIYADIEKTFGGEVDTNWQWNLGVRYSF